MISELRADELVKTYKGRSVVKNVSLSVQAGHIVGLLGPNGAGKTTSFYMVSGLIAPDAGQVYLNTQDITPYPMHRRAQLGVGYLPQEASVFRRLSVEKNILSILETRPELDAEQRQEQLEALLEEFHIGHIRRSLGASLSGGERRRVEIARALARDPKFILLDEPFAGVDPISVMDIKRQISHLATRGIGILITDHNVRETLNICETAYIMCDGEVIAAGDPDAILNNQQVREVYLGDQFTL